MATAPIRKKTRRQRLGPRWSATPASAAAPQHRASTNRPPDGGPARRSPAPGRRSKRSGRQRLRLWTAPAALSRLLLHLFHLRRDGAGLRTEGHILGVMLFELGDRLVRERAPVLVLFHIRD